MEFARKLAGLGVELHRTAGGTNKLLRDWSVSVKDISNSPASRDVATRVKTSTLAKEDSAPARESLCTGSMVAEHGIAPIDMVVVNLYAFEKTAAKPGVPFEDLIENIDIAGSSMIRSAAENFQDVVVVTSPGDYNAIAEEMTKSGGELSAATKWRLAQKAFATTAAYDSAIASTLERVSANGHFEFHPEAGFPQNLRLSFGKVMDLRYGENPHQKAAMYSDGSGSGVANGRQIQGKELSYNNIVDLQAAWDLAQEFDETVCAIIKHTNPCGTATGTTQAEAYRKALECDPVSAFGGVIGVNGTRMASRERKSQCFFSRSLPRPGSDGAARAKFAAKKNLRLVEITDVPQKWVLKNVSGGILVQDADARPLQEADLKVVTKRQPTPEEKRALLFAWKVAKHVKSNAILYARDGQTVGVGAGQMSRVDSCKIGAMKAVRAAERARWQPPMPIFHPTGSRKLPK